MTTEIPLANRIHALPALATEQRSFKARVKQAKKQNKKMQNRIARAVASGNRHRALALQSFYIRSASARIEAVAEGHKKLRRSPRRHPTELLEIAMALNPFTGSEEAARVSARDKPNRQFRPIVSFGIEQKALQILMRNAVWPFVQTDPRQHALTNGGRNAACGRIMDAIRKDAKWFIGLDIRNFYGSINRERINDIITVPTGALQATIRLPENINIGRIGNAIGPINLLDAARRGVSQGSSFSPIIAELVCKEILRSVSSRFVVINYADDFGIMARTKREAKLISKTLISAARRSRFGHFQLIVKTRHRRVADGFDFLGYFFRKRNGEIRCEPSSKNCQEFFNKSYDHMRRVGRQSLDAVINLQKYVKSWTAAFPLWNAGKQIYWPRYWVQQIAKTNLPHLTEQIENAMLWSDNNFHSTSSAQSGQNSRSSTLSVEHRSLHICGQPITMSRRSSTVTEMERQVSARHRNRPSANDHNRPHEELLAPIFL